MSKWINILKVGFFSIFMVGVLNSRSLGGEVDEKSQDKYRIVLGDRGESPITIFY